MLMLWFTLVVLSPFAFGQSISKCTFDYGLCHFNNSGAYLWTRHSGSTPSGNTGPTHDHTTGSGYYMYMESSSPNYPNAGPYILNTTVDEGGMGIVSFWYNMYGLAIGTLSFDISENGVDWRTIWSKSGDQGEAWGNVTLFVNDISTHYRFYGITGTDYTGDIAIDDVNVTARITPAPSITSAPTISFSPSSVPSPVPSPVPSTITITTDTQFSNRAVSNATLEVVSDIVLDETITLTDINNLVVNGNDNKLYASGLFRCFSLTGGSYSFYDLKISNGYASAYGGAFIIETAVVLLARCTIENNTAAAAAGGGVYFAHGGVLTIHDTVFRGNTAANGGALRVNSETSTDTILYLYNTSFYDNTATISNGGALVASNGAVLSLSGGSIENNFATADGGGIACYSAFVTIMDVEIKGNRGESGGGISCDSSTDFNITNFVVSNNQALRGGGVFVGGSYTQVLLNNGLISKNYAIGDSGGGVYVASGNFHTTDCVYSYNYANGPIFTTTTGSCISRGGCFFSMNYPSDYTVDEYCEYTVGSNGTLLVNSFNTEPEYDFLHLGGVLYAGRVGPECVEVFEGDVIIWASDLALVSSGFQICYSVTSSGGGLHLVGGHSYIHNCSFISNNATRNGGGFNLDGGTAVVSTVSLQDNEASGGNAIYITSGSFDAEELSMNGVIEGVSSESATCSSPCKVGEFGNCTVAIGASDCYVNCQCFKCPAGYYSSSVGSVDESDCLSCGAGQVSSEGAASCTSCSLGKYATDDVNDVQGGLITQVSSAATSCNDCPVGYFTDTTSTLVCQACAAGEYSGWGASSCVDCEAGRYSGGGASNCTDCAAGFYGNAPALSSCTACSAGTYQPVSGSSSCVDCPKGKSQGATGQSSCNDCDAGSFSAHAGESVCSNCDSFGSGYTSVSGSSTCDHCLSSYYLDPLTTVCRECDSSNSVCPSESGIELPAPTVGFWIDTHKLNSFSGGAIDIYRCSRLTCKGSTPESSSCWLPSNLTNCNRDDLLCTNGATGPLCGACSSGYVYSSTDRYCITCTASIFRMSFMAIIVLLALVVFVLIKFDKINCTWWGRTWLGSSMKQIDSGPGRVLWTNYQIIQSVSYSLDVSLPWPFSKMVGGMSFISFDFLTLKCFESNYLLAVILWSLLPVLIIAINFIIYSIRISRLQASSIWNYCSDKYGTASFSGGGVNSGVYQSGNVLSSKQHRRKLATNYLRQHMTFFILLSYLVVPSITRKQLAALDCVEVSDAYYVRAETKVSCDNQRYQLFLFGNAIFLSIYLSLPLVWLVLLFRKRTKIRATAGSLKQEIDQSMVLRKEHKDELEPLRLLFHVYRPSLYFLEALEIYRRILFVGIIPLVSIRAARRAAFGMLLGLISAISFRELDPFVRASTNVLAYVASYTVVLTFGAALVLDTNLNRNLNNTLFGCILMIVNLGVVALALVLGAKRAFAHSRGGWENRVLSTQEFEIVKKIMDERLESVDGSEGPPSFLMADDQLKQGPNKGNDTNKFFHRPGKLEKHLIDPSQVETMKRIGAGAFGEVFMGRYDGQLVAIKTVLDVTDLNLRNFRDEILLTASLRHPNIVNFVGACWGRELICLVLEWVPKGTMQQILDENTDMRWEDPLLRLCIDIARGMTYLHGRKFTTENGASSSGVIHRDLKPENVLVTDFLSAKISDFGASRGKADSDVMMTSVGTPLFCAPEVMRGELYDEKADVYAFGMLLMISAVDQPILGFIKERFILMNPAKSRRASVQMKSQMKIIRPLIESDWRPVTKEKPIAQAPPVINDLLIRCIAAAPTDRPSYSEILAELEGCLSTLFDGKSYTRSNPEKNLEATDSQAQERLEVDANGEERRISENPMLQHSGKHKQVAIKTDKDGEGKSGIMTELTKI